MPRRSRLAKTTVHKLAPLSYAPSLTHFDRPRLIGVQGINVSSTAAPSSAIWLVTVGLRAGDRLILHQDCCGEHHREFRRGGQHLSRTEYPSSHVRERPGYCKVTLP